MANGNDGTMNVTKGKLYRFSYEIQQQFKGFSSSTADYCASLQLMADGLCDVSDSKAKFLECIAADPESPISEAVAIESVQQMPINNVASACGHVLESDEPSGAELCRDCLQRKISALAIASNSSPATRPPSWATARKPVTPQSNSAIKARNRCPHGFDYAACSICGNVDVGF